MLYFRYDSQHGLLVMPLPPQKWSLGCDASSPKELFYFSEHILTRVWLMLNRWVTSRSKHKVFLIPVSLHRNSYNFSKPFGRRKAEVSLFLHSTPWCHRSMHAKHAAVADVSPCILSKKPEPTLSALDYFSLR